MHKDSGCIWAKTIEYSLWLKMFILRLTHHIKKKLNNETKLSWCLQIE